MTDEEEITTSLILPLVRGEIQGGRRARNYTAKESVLIVGVNLVFTHYED
jgi:hypothetical protein